MTFNWKKWFTLNKKEIIGGFIISVVTFIGLCIGFKYNDNQVYYQIIFDSNGGSEVAGQNVLIGGQVSPPSDTIRDGYVFKGWYLGKEKYDFSLKVRQDMTLIAKWKKIEDIITDSKIKEKIKNNDKVDNNLNDTVSNGTSNSETNNSLKDNSNASNSSNSQSSNVVSSVPKQIVNVSSIALNTTNLSLKVGDSATLVASIFPTNATNRAVSWSSSNSGIVSVTNGSIRAISSGTAVIKATAGGKTASCTVVVPNDVTYSYEMVDVTSSAIGQCYIYIKRSDGQRVSGTVEINYINGTSEKVQVPSGGIMRVKSTISLVKVISAG